MGEPLWNPYETCSNGGSPVSQLGISGCSAKPCTMACTTCCPHSSAESRSAWTCSPMFTHVFPCSPLFHLTKPLFFSAGRGDGTPPGPSPGRQGQGRAKVQIHLHCFRISSAPPRNSPAPEASASQGLRLTAGGGWGG